MGSSFSWEPCDPPKTPWESPYPGGHGSLCDPPSSFIRVPPFQSPKLQGGLVILGATGTPPWSPHSPWGSPLPWGCSGEWPPPSRDPGGPHIPPSINPQTRGSHSSHHSPSAAQCTPHSGWTRERPPGFIVKVWGELGGRGGHPLTPWCCSTLPWARKSGF